MHLICVLFSDRHPQCSKTPITLKCSALIQDIKNMKNRKCKSLRFSNTAKGSPQHLVFKHGTKTTKKLRQKACNSLFFDGRDYFLDRQYSKAIMDEDISY